MEGQISVLYCIFLSADVFLSWATVYRPTQKAECYSLREFKSGNDSAHLSDGNLYCNVLFNLVLLCND